jgi:uncharacterized protein
VATEHRLRILSIEGGGIRGLIPALVIEEIERRLEDATGDKRPLSDWFHLLAGTSTGGLIALGMAAPDESCMNGEKLVSLYRDEGPRIFRFTSQRLRSLGGWTGPKHSPAELRSVLEERIGQARLKQATRDVVVTAYDMTEREPHFFKRWRAREDETRNPTMVDAAMATAAAPTYFPSQEIAGSALVDGGVFAANPTIAAITEALKRTTDQPVPVDPHELFVVSLGTGVRESGFPQRRVRGWGKIGWILPKDGEAALLGAVFDGQSDAADHWAHMLLNHEPGRPAPREAAVGAGPRYFRLQTTLPRTVALDDASERSLDELDAAASRLIADSADELETIAERLVRAGPIAT